MYITLKYQFYIKIIYSKELLSFPFFPKHNVILIKF